MARSSYYRFLQGIVFALLLSPAVHSDILLSEDSVDGALKNLDFLSLEIQQADDRSAQIAANYALGLEATSLAELLSKEFAAHGELEKILIELAIEGAAEHAVVIDWSGEHQRFYYDGAAFRQYIKLDDRGPHAADCWFRIVEQQFYFSRVQDRGSLAASAATKQAFLQSYPGYDKADKVGIFLSIDYRDIWRGCRTIGDRECAARYLELTRDQLQRIASDYTDTNSGNIATRLLIRIEKELANPPTA